MTLGGMAAAVGLIIDDAIVMSEHIIRRLRARKGTRAPGDAGGGRVHQAAGRIVALDHRDLHIPLAFLIGVTGAFFAALSLTMAASLVISSSSRGWRSPSRGPSPAGRKMPARGGRLMTRVHRLYPRLMRPLLPRPWLIVSSIFRLVGLGYLCVSTALAPASCPPWTKAASSSITCPARHVADGDRPPAAPGRGHPPRHAGGADLFPAHRSAAGRRSERANTGDFFVRLKPFPRRASKRSWTRSQGKSSTPCPAEDRDRSSSWKT